MVDLRDKTALVTGSSSGIGAAIAETLAKRGANVILHGRTKSAHLNSVKNRISELNDSTTVLECDFAKTALLETFAADAWGQFDGIDVLVNNAGGDVLTGEQSNWDFERQLEYLLKVDVTATLMLSRMIGAKMATRFATRQQDNNTKRENYSITNIGWDQAFQGMAGDSGEMFSATKGAIMAMTLSLAQSLAPSVRVNCVAPGWIKTQWGENANDRWNQRAVDESLMARWGSPQDIANTIAHLASDEAGFVNGQIISVNGGFKYFQGI